MCARILALLNLPLICCLYSWLNCWRNRSMHWLAASRRRRRLCPWKRTCVAWFLCKDGCRSVNVEQGRDPLGHSPFNLFCRVQRNYYRHLSIHFMDNPLLKLKIRQRAMIRNIWVARVEFQIFDVCRFGDLHELTSWLAQAIQEHSQKIIQFVFKHCLGSNDERSFDA